MNVGDYKFPGDHPHHATSLRAWCGCGEWCYLATGGYVCACCRGALADANPCTRCDGTGVEPDGASPVTRQVLRDVITRVGGVYGNDEEDDDFIDSMFLEFKRGSRE